MPQDPGTMYRWRTWTEEQRQIIYRERFERNYPHHSPAHLVSDHTSIYLVTAACYEHRPLIGATEQRIVDFTLQLYDLIHARSRFVFAWVVLPNHYHFLADIPDLFGMLGALGQNHGRTSFQWNGEDDSRGRKVWCNAAETAMKSEGHFYATVNYVLHNPVHHGYCEKWTDWPFSSAKEYLESVGRDKAERVWHAYPIYDYGKNWDPAEL